MPILIAITGGSGSGKSTLAATRVSAKVLLPEPEPPVMAIRMGLEAF